MINGGLFIRLDVIRFRIYVGGDEIKWFWDFFMVDFYGWVCYLDIFVMYGCCCGVCYAIGLKITP